MKYRRRIKITLEISADVDDERYLSIALARGLSLFALSEDFTRGTVEPGQQYKTAVVVGMDTPTIVSVGVRKIWQRMTYDGWPDWFIRFLPKARIEDLIPDFYIGGLDGNQKDRT